jgi:hypothetical protein
LEEGHSGGLLLISGSNLHKRKQQKYDGNGKGPGGWYMSRRDWELGYNQGYAVGFEEGYDKGYGEGVSLGHNNGFVAALEEPSGTSDPRQTVVTLQKLTGAGLVSIVLSGTAAKTALALFEQLGIKVEIQSVLD